MRYYGQRTDLSPRLCFARRVSAENGGCRWRRRRLRLYTYTTRAAFRADQKNGNSYLFITERQWPHTCELQPRTDTSLFCSTQRLQMLISTPNHPPNPNATILPRLDVHSLSPRSRTTASVDLDNITVNRQDTGSTIAASGVNLD